MSRDRSVYVCNCTRCGTENNSEEKEFRCVKCDVSIRLIWMAEYERKETDDAGLVLLQRGV